MREFTICLLFFLSHLASEAQQYTWGIGVHAGKFNTGITYKNFINADNASGFQVDGYRTNVASGGYTLRGLLIKQVRIKLPIVRVPLDFVVGAGLHSGLFPNRDQSYYKRHDKEARYYSSRVISAGLDATLQIEYQLPKRVAPLTLAIEAIPFYEFYNPGPEYFDVGFSVRYIFR